jgi:hypothetical protein
LRRSRQIEEIRRKIYAGYRQVQKDLQMIACTPDHVIPMLKMILEVLRPGFSPSGLTAPFLLPSGSGVWSCSIATLSRPCASTAKTRVVSTFERAPGSVPLVRETGYATISNPSALSYSEAVA